MYLETVSGTVCFLGYRPGILRCARGAHQRALLLGTRPWGEPYSMRWATSYWASEDSLRARLKRAGFRVLRAKRAPWVTVYVDRRAYPRIGVRQAVAVATVLGAMGYDASSR